MWGQFCCCLSVSFSVDCWVSSSSICLLHIYCSPPLWVEASGFRCFLVSLKFVYVSYFPYCPAVEMFLLHILVSSASVTEYHKLSDFKSTSEAESLKNQDGRAMLPLKPVRRDLSLAFLASAFAGNPWHPLVCR